MDGVRIGGIEFEGRLDVSAGFLEIACGGCDSGGEAMVNRKFGIEIDGVADVLRGAFVFAQAMEMERGEMMRAGIVRSGLEQDFDVMSEVARAIEV